MGPTGVDGGRAAGPINDETPEENSRDANSTGGATSPYGRQKAFAPIVDRRVRRPRFDPHPVGDGCGKW